MTTLAFNGHRLTAARARRATTKTSLSTALGITLSTLNRFEEGKASPDHRHITAMSQELNFPLSFFFGDDLDGPPLEGAHFRAPSNMTKRTSNKIRAVTSIGLLFYSWLGDYFRLPDVDIPTYETADPEIAADTLRREWGLGCAPIFDIIPLIESRGAIVFSLPADCMNVDAFSFWTYGRPFVFLNTTKSPERTRMDVAHELAHLVLHNADCSGSKEREREAASFASAFLMPRESVIAQLPRVFTLTQVISGKRIWRVSAAALTVRLHKLGLISESAYRDLFIDINRLGYRKNEPEPCRPEASQLLRKITNLLREDGLSLKDVSQKIGVHVQEISEFLQNLTIVALPHSKVSPESTEHRTGHRSRSLSLVPDSGDSGLSIG